MSAHTYEIKTTEGVWRKVISSRLFYAWPGDRRRDGKLFSGPINPDWLIVFVPVWTVGIRFVDRKGKEQIVDSIQAARDYAAKHQYLGIRILATY